MVGWQNPLNCSYKLPTNEPEKGKNESKKMSEKETIEWNFMEEDEAIFVKKLIGIIHTYYEKPPTQFIIIAAWLMKKRLEELDGPQINDLNIDWNGDIN